MARQARLDLPGIAQHILQGGNDRQPCIFSSIDYDRYRQDLREIAIAEHCAVHAYVLMTNHIHPLLTPRDTGNEARLMQSLGLRYVGYINNRYHRTGTLWEGRYKARAVDGDAYVMRCYRYIELNPVRAAMVADPADYPWSSYHANGSAAYDPLVRTHPAYRQLAATKEERCGAYRQLVSEAMNDEDVADIRLHLYRQRAYRNPRFHAAIEEQLGRRAGPAKIGRPLKARTLEESLL